MPLIVSGATDWTDVDVIFNTLDKVRERIKQNRNQEIFLCHNPRRKASRRRAVDTNSIQLWYGLDGDQFPVTGRAANRTTRLTAPVASRQRCADH